MPDMAIVVSALVFFGTMLLLFAGFQYLKYRREHAKLVEKVKTGGLASRVGDYVPEAPETGSPMKNLFLKTSIWAGGLTRPKENGSEASALRSLFLKAGIRHPSAAAVFWGAKVLFAVALPFLAFFVQAFAESGFLRFQVLLIMGVLALLGFYLPDFYLMLRIRLRKEKIVKGFPDALDLLVVCVEAGMGLDAAINRVAEEIQLSSQVISDEFKILNLELRAGKSRIDALRNLGIRTDVEDVRSFATLLIQTDRFGTSVAQALRVHSDSMRTRRYQKAEELAAKLPVKMMFPLIFFIFPAIFVIVVGPAAIQIYQSIIAR
jgi:tight adherence protein C